jgi:hypothetical protein
LKTGQKSKTGKQNWQWLTVNHKKIKIQAKIYSNLFNPPSNKFLHLLKKEAQPPFDLQVVGVLMERTKYL